eukprot:scaffold60593_cov32-Tisochrysis_lutea.AAC.1
MAAWAAPAEEAAADWVRIHGRHRKANSITANSQVEERKMGLGIGPVVVCRAVGPVEAPCLYPIDKEGERVGRPLQTDSVKHTQVEGRRRAAR